MRTDILWAIIGGALALMALRANNAPRVTVIPTDEPMREPARVIFREGEESMT
jgi:hypothetical protein